MDKTKNRLLTGMSDVGCSPLEIEEAKRLLETDSTQALIKHLRRCRCGLVDEMHESQQKVDRMDYLIRQAEKRNF